MIQTILLVDDSEHDRESYTRALRHSPYTILDARTMAAGLAMAVERRPDLILVDDNLPDGSGLDFLRHLKNSGEAPPVVMLTGFGSEAVAVEAIKAGAYDYLIKDVEGRHLELLPTVVERTLREHALVPAKREAERQLVQAQACRADDARADIGSRRPAPVVAGRLARLRVLVVEDNDINRKVALEILRRAGALVQVAANGQTALAMLSAGGAAFDAVLMDIQMPGMDGYEVTRIIRGQPGLAALPVIAMTANVTDADRRQAAEAGMNAHVAKPIDADLLINTLRALVPEESVQNAMDSQGGAVPAPEGEIALPVDLPGIDLRTALIRLGGNRELWISLMHQFAASQGDAPSQVRRLLAAGQDAEAAGRMHRLRGVAANLGALDVARLAVDVEAAIKDGKQDLVPDLLASLEKAMAGIFEVADRLPGPEQPGAAPADPACLRRRLPELRQLLRESNLEAVHVFTALRPAIAAQLTPEATGVLAAAVESLDFAAAEGLVNGLMESLRAG